MTQIPSPAGWGGLQLETPKTDSKIRNPKLRKIFPNQLSDVSSSLTAPYNSLSIVSPYCPKSNSVADRQPDLWGWSSRRKLHPPCPTANPSPASAQYTVCLPKSICKGVLSQQSLTSQPSIREFLSTAKPPEKGKKKQKPWPPWLRSRRSACYRVSAHPRRELPTPSWDLRLYVIDVSSLLPSHRIDVQTPSNQQKSPKQRGPKEPSTLPNRPLLRHYQTQLILEGGERWHLSPPVSQQAVQPTDADKGPEEQSQLLSEEPVLPRLPKCFGVFN
nr:motile sperm domain-containing protein 1 isoform X1 [Dasypus novemcinctus]